MISVFLEEISNKNNKSENTLEAYEKNLLKFEEFLINKENKETFDLLSVNQKNIEEFIFFMKSENQSQGTINRRISSIKTFYKYIVDKGLLKENPADKIKTNKVSKKMPTYLSIDEINTLLELPDDTYKGLRDKAMLELLYGTGIKVSEMINLNIEDVHFDLSYIVCKTIYGKARIVPMGSYAKKALFEYLKIRELNLRKGLNLEGALFANYQGHRFTRQGFWKIMKDYGNKVSFGDKLSPTALRNSFAIHMLQNGANVKAVQELMGNENMQSMEIFLEIAGVKIKDVYNKTHPRA